MLFVEFVEFVLLAAAIYETLAVGAAGGAWFVCPQTSVIVEQRAAAAAAAVI